MSDNKKDIRKRVQNLIVGAAILSVVLLYLTFALIIYIYSELSDFPEKGYNPNDEYHQTLFEQKKQVGESFRLSSVFPMEWDYAYVNEQFYATDERIERELEIDMNGYDFDLYYDPLNVIIFVKDNKCTYAFIYMVYHEFRFLPVDIKIAREKDAFVAHLREEDVEFIAENY